jgi:dipeptidyl aminopeptidase/acylaminoacyl peptidase
MWGVFISCGIIKTMKKLLTIKKTCQFGRWPSPISAQKLGGRLRLGDARWASDGKGWIWLESISGKGHLNYSRPGKTVQDLTGEEYDVCGRVGYGGGEFALCREFIIFANRDGRLYRREWKTGKIKPITPGWGSLASPVISPNQRWAMFVFSDGEKDLIGVVNAQGFGWPASFVCGADFYMQPVWHPEGEQIAWVEWDHPHLPWQASRIKLGEVGGMQIKLFSEDWVAGSQDQPASQPLFSPDGKWLSFITTKGDWDQLVIMKLKDKKKRVLVEGEGIYFGTPGWVQGQRTYGWSADSQCIFYRHVQGGQASLSEVRVKNGNKNQISIAPFTWISQLDISIESDKLIFRATSPRKPQRLVSWQEGKLKSLSIPAPLDFSSEFLPEPVPVHWQAHDGTTIHGIYFAPTNPEFTSKGKPPLIVEVHAGPTMNNLLVYVPERAFFTSRGYALVAVDYRGSSGYGRSYQDAIRNQWGIVDVEDAVGAARAMVEQGLADEKRMAVLGSSAGGFTVLNTLILHPGLFKAGICAYPVCDLMSDAQQTHKLERHYNEYLIGDLKKDLKRYQQRSPLLHADKIQDPIAIFHGEKDAVVSVNQSQEIAKILDRRGIPHLYKIYPGEGHGFRKKETIIDYYQKMEWFIKKYLLS